MNHMTDVNILLADFAIRQLHARFNDAAWRKDAASFAGCFAEDGEWHIAGMHLRGRDEIGATFAKLIGYCERSLMLSGTPALNISPQQATGRTYVTEYMKKSDGTPLRTIGIYEDDYVGNGSHWVFRSRTWILCYRGPPDLSGPFTDIPELAPPLGPRLG